MPLSNFERMIQLADEVFATKSDPDQLDINPEVLQHLKGIHPATVSEYDDGNGPVAWILLIPTTPELEKKFLEGKITEKELYEFTPLDVKYEALYLCSAMVLEEYRRKGIAEQLTLRAVESIRKDHPIKSLFVWTSSQEGLMGSEKLARVTALHLMKK
jgi:hypothetical protein